MNKKNPHIGSDFDQWLEEENLLKEVEAIAAKRVLVWKLAQFMEKKHYSKVTLSTLMHTSRAQLDRLLDPTSTAVTLKTLARAAEVMGKKLQIKFA